MTVYVDGGNAYHCAVCVVRVWKFYDLYIHPVLSYVAGTCIGPAEATLRIYMFISSIVRNSAYNSPMDGVVRAGNFSSTHTHTFFCRTTQRRR